MEKVGILLVSRITPTYMGNTRQGATKSRATQDHPHIHGEYYSDVTEIIYDEGSPPHTWGIRTLTRWRHVRCRITPTYMGNTLHQLAR